LISIPRTLGRDAKEQIPLDVNVMERFMRGDVKLAQLKKDESLEKVFASIAPELKFEKPKNFVDVEISVVLNRATDVLGDRDKALRWMGTPSRGLGFATPISLLGTSEGVQSVEDILTQMEHGVW
jgi:uncharacterized protein (DUF2384 family)